MHEWRVCPREGGLIWEEALFLHYGPQVADNWTSVHAAHAAPVEAKSDLVIDTILQEAAERSAQRGLATTLAKPARSRSRSAP